MRLPALVTLLLLAGAAPAAAHHPGDRLDEVMAEKEPAFEPTDSRRMPALSFAGSDGASLDMSGLADRIVVLSFLPEGCGTPCADQQALLQEVRDAVNVTPMRELVQFMTVSGDAALDPDGEAGNWRSVMPSDETVEAAAAAFAAVSAAVTSTAFAAKSASAASDSAAAAFAASAASAGCFLAAARAAAAFSRSCQAS